MTVTVAEIKKLQRDIKQLQRRMAKLEKQKSSTRAASHKRVKRTARTTPTCKGRAEESERERAIELLRRAGLLREMTPREKKIAARWDSLSPDEKTQVQDTLRAVRIDPPLSQLVHDMRG